MSWSVAGAVVIFFPLLRCQADVIYCDKKFDLLNRTDESFERCRWLERISPSDLSECEGGLECDGECVPFSDWCRPTTGSRSWRCGALLYSPELCGNKTFWSGRECGEREGRCTGWWPGQCSPPGGCTDRSDQNFSHWDSVCIQGGHTLLNISSPPGELTTCRGRSNYTVCAVRCDRRLDGCLDDSDEANCVAQANVVTHILLLIPCLLLTLVIIEWLIRAGAYDKVNKKPLLSERGRLRAEMNEDPDVDVPQNLAEFCKIILDRNNWDLGLRDDSVILHPSYHEGGFDVEKIGKLKQIYKSIRKSRKDSLQYISYTIRMDQRIDDIEVSEALKHYSHYLIYQHLEKDYLEERGFCHSTDLDISIKNALTTEQASHFYGHVFPYFDPIGSLIKYTRKNWKGFYQFLGKTQFLLKKIPHFKEIKYCLIVIISIIGWYLDFIKDILIATDLSFLYSSFWDFKSQIVVILWTTVFLSQTIIGAYILVKFWRKPSQIFGIGINGFSQRATILARVIFILLAPVSPAILIYVNESAERKLRQNEKELMLLDETNISDRISLFEHRQQLIKDKDKLEKLLRIAYKIENVLENAPQLLIQLLIVLMSASLLQLPGVTGIQAVFDDHVSGNFLSSTFFYFSIGWSLQSICNGHITSHFMRKKCVPDLGKVLIILLHFVACTTRIVAIVFFFTPALGIFNIMLPYSIDNHFISNYSQDVEKEIGTEVIQDMADISWYYLGPEAPRSVLFLFTFFPLLHLVLMLILRGKALLTSLTPTYNLLQDLGRTVLTCRPAGISRPIQNSLKTVSK